MGLEHLLAPLGSGDVDEPNGGGGGVMSFRVLDDLFRCERFLGTFPHGMPLRACLRRQDERREVRNDKGKVIERVPVHEFCASGTCELGRANRARAGGEAPPAPAEEPVLLPKGPPASSRIWSGEVPDVPLGPPPARPAVEETTMEKTKACERCGKELRADNSKGICGDRGACTKRMNAAAGEKIAELRAAPREAARKVRAASAARPARARKAPRSPLVELEALSVVELVELRDQAQLELERRLDLHEEEGELLRKAVAASIAGVAAQVALEEASGS